MCAAEQAHEKNTLNPLNEVSRRGYSVPINGKLVTIYISVLPEVDTIDKRPKGKTLDDCKLCWHSGTHYSNYSGYDNVCSFLPLKTPVPMSPYPHAQNDRERRTPRILVTVRPNTHLETPTTDSPETLRSTISSARRPRGRIHLHSLHHLT